MPLRFRSCWRVSQADCGSVCRLYSELISAAIAAGGPHAARTSQVGCPFFRAFSSLPQLLCGVIVLRLWLQHKLDT